MKTMKYILMALAAFSLFFTSCTDETFEGEGGKPTAGMVKLNISIPASDIVTPMTKSSQADADAITDLTVLVYDNIGNIIKGESKYYESVTLTDHKIALSLPIAAGSKSIHLVANAEGLISELTTLTLLKAKTFSLDDQKNPQLVVYGCVAGDENGYVTVPAAGLSASVEMKRIYSMITVEVDKKGLNKDITITPTTVSLKHIPNAGALVGPSKIGANGITTADYLGDISIGDLGHSSVNAFFMYENAQPKGFYNESQGEISKTPASIGSASTSTETVNTDQTCSYIEVHATVKKSGYEEGNITYRFFLGKNATNDFNVERNTHYQITLCLKGNGGLNEASWRVNANLLSSFTVEDMYIGYESGATNTLKASEGWTITGVTEEVASGKRQQLTINGTSGQVTTNFINLNEQQYVPIKVKVTAKRTEGSDSQKETNATVYQAIRLVDPIAYFRKASNISAVSVDVKEFNLKTKAFEILQSVGAWTATLTTGEGSFALSVLEDGETQATRVSDSKITGTGGPVRFKYTPNSASIAPLFGVIDITYHNNACKHKIFLRQGYDGNVVVSGTEWSMFNLQEDKKKATFPTETGWFFPAGESFSLHPFTPGFHVKDVAIQAKGYNTETIMHWDGKLSWVNKTPQGPCPESYSVPEWSDYEKLKNIMDVYVGYVHDDSPTAGWSFSGNGTIKLDDNNWCNPAKGTLLVKKGTTESLFFSYGKGVSTDHSYIPKENEFKGTGIDEIGIGYRQRGVGLNYSIGANARYGAQYWTRTQTDNELILADFWYDAAKSNGFGKVYDAAGAGGGSFADNAAFVRCVKKQGPKQIIVTKVGTAFYEKGSTFELTFTAKKEDVVIISGNGIVTKTVNVSASGETTVTLTTSRHDALGTIMLSAEGYDTAYPTFSNSGKLGRDYTITGNLYYGWSNSKVPDSSPITVSPDKYVSKINVPGKGEYSMTLKEGTVIINNDDNITFNCKIKNNDYSSNGKTKLKDFFSTNPTMTLYKNR